MELQGVGVLVGGEAALVTELGDPSWVQSGLGVWHKEGEETVKQEERGETPPHLCGVDGSGGEVMKRHGDLGYEGSLQLLHQNLPDHIHRKALLRWG